MARPKQPIPAVQKNIALPAALVEKLDIHLFSELEMKVPHGAYKELFTKLAEQYLQSLSAPCPHCLATGVQK